MIIMFTMMLCMTVTIPLGVRQQPREVSSTSRAGGCASSSGESMLARVSRV